MRRSLHGFLLQHAWHDLPAELQAVHGRRPLRLVGIATVERGRGWIARLGASLTRLPAAASDAPLEVELSATSSPQGPAEYWVRRFGRSAAMASRLRMHSGLLVETIGAASLSFLLEPGQGGICWQPRSWRLFGVPMPQRWLSGVEAREFVDCGRYGFDVRVHLPGIGLVVHYRGRLAIADTRVPAS